VSGLILGILGIINSNDYQVQVSQVNQAEETVRQTEECFLGNVTPSKALRLLPFGNAGKIHPDLLTF
jgi:hypothetical protein